MIPADETAFEESLNAMTKNEVIAEAMDLYRKCTAYEIARIENDRAEKHFLEDYQKMKTELSEAREKIRSLEKQNLHLSGVQVIQSKTLFGRSSEKTGGILNSSSNDIPTDPVSEDAEEELPSDPDDNGTGSARNPNPKKPAIGSRGKKKPGKRKRDLSSLPSSEVYEYDLDELNRTFGKGNWWFAFWHKHEQVEVIKQTTYLKVTYTPAISVGLEHDLISIPYDGALIPKSFASSSLVSEIMTDKYALYLPTYRQEHAIERFGIPLSRQTMTNWVNRLSRDLLKPAYDHLCETLKTVSHQQCDETPYMVINDGLVAGHKGFVWIHRTSELLNGPEIIIYSYENSRAADHLRNFYGELSCHISITCDAYSGYTAFENDNPEEITLGGCLMHARRRFVVALSTINTKDLSEEAINGLPEMKGIILSNEIFEHDHPLKYLPPEERLRLRQETVKPSVVKYFEFVNSFDIEDPSLSEKLKDAITYSRNNETRLRRFLDDPFIPIDNGACERNVKPIALGRRNYLFSYSLSGAESTMVISSLIETAKANAADPYYYLKYLLDRMPAHVYRGVPIENRDDLLPWSEKYREYEKAQKENLLSLKAPPGNLKPKSPKKSDYKVVKKTA